MTERIKGRSRGTGRLLIEHDSLRDEHKDLRAALQALVSWKDYKDAHGKDGAYKQGQRAAWARAREVLAAVQRMMYARAEG